MAGLGPSSPTLAERLQEIGKAAFEPSQDETTGKQLTEDYEKLVAKSSVIALIPALNALIKPDVSPPWLREHFLRTLTRLPLRPHGVRATMEFVFSVHPSNVGRIPDSDVPQKQGANITHEAVAVATKLLSSVPGGMSAEDWFGGISAQLFKLLDGEAGPEVSKTAAQVVGFGILGKRQFGAPGAPGWNAFVMPIITDINPSLLPETPQDVHIHRSGGDEVVDLSLGQVLVTSQSLQRSLQRLRTLILSNPAPGLCRRLLTPVLHQLCLLASWIEPSKTQDEGVRKPALILFQTFLKLFGTHETILPILRNLESQGSSPESKVAWIYRTNPKGEIDIVPVSDTVSQRTIEWPALDAKAVTLVESIVTMCPPEEISSLFLHLLEGWIQSQGNTHEIKLGLTSSEASSSGNAFKELIEVSVLQKLMEKAPDKLVSRFDQLLELVCQVLQTDERSQLGEDIIAIVLSLLNLIIGAPSFRKSDINPEKLDIVEGALQRIGQQDRPAVAPTARNLQMLLKYRGEVDRMEDEEQPRMKIDSKTMEDRRTYALSMEYITGQDSPPPVVSEGLNMLTNLIKSGSSVLDITATLVLMSNLLTNNEDFINLRVINIFTMLAAKHPKATVEEITEHYLDAQEKSSTDVRLRFGEALLRVVERLGEIFTGDIARQTCETLLSIAGRRGYRPKTLAKQVREERLNQLKKAKGRMKEDDIPEEDEDEDMTEEDKANNDILAQIVSGWESKRGSEDVRMRSSALSIFGAALEINIGGIGATLASAGIDLCINVLTLEPEPEKGILRRAAVIVVLSFVRALSAARDARRSLGFGLTDESRRDMIVSLNYIAGTDNDGLVREQAKDVVESLENWAMSTMVPMTGPGNTELQGLTRLAGLSVNPVMSPGSNDSGQIRPRIEEIE
ncbi:hypothetical protein NLU13_3396 [Sarocladium strictum]|uniref:Protein required for cell viability n=1 Tax=Sarocladium strictum TaxID=5046 RepID=A0AA39LA92_SARSR|nr:hypothetical protein NLU13_3396 [Sarocladium strictum]